ncbi:hypothetical protein C8Z91_22855 [Paenibacillus elgii]|uniref:DUF4829 domain-containing protein n=1 Tax=Paenibacillus elgii TaxID=189691 RepID=A0A2T6FYM4_9BACL|nr:hypothetical protein C8Z91_22855 [Paenibacillus elgii]
MLYYHLIPKPSRGFAIFVVISIFRNNGEAQVSWDEKTKTVVVVREDADAMKERVALLEEAVAADSPKEAVQTFAKGLKNRNGALQYAVMSKKMREEIGNEYAANRWQTGSSSPWYASITANEGVQNDDGTWLFELHGVLTDSTNQQEDWRFSFKALKENSRWVVEELKGKD